MSDAIERLAEHVNGTSFEDIPDDWQCPECGAAKSDYDLIEG